MPIEITARESATITVVAPGAAIGDESVPVAPLSIALAAGATLDFGGGHVVVLASAAGIGDEDLTTVALGFDLEPGDEATSLGIDPTTYATVAQADARAEQRRGSVLAAWEDVDDEDKLAALIAASEDLDTLEWIGDRATPEQTREWPRSDAVGAVSGYEYGDDTWPSNLVTATMELAFARAASYGDDAETDPLNPDLSAGNIKRKKTGPIEKEYFAPTTTTASVTSIERFPPIVQNLLRDLIRVALSGEWGSSTAVRSS